MKPLKATLLLLVLLIGYQSHAQQEKYSKVKIEAPSDPARFGELIALLEIDHFDYVDDGAISAEISASELQRLKQTGYKYKVLVDDVVKNLEEENRRFNEARTQGRLPFEETGSTVDAIIPTPAAFEVKTTLGGYYSYPEMEDAIDDLVAAYPAIAQKGTVGQSTGGREIWYVKISDNVATDESEPEVLYIGIQHAREAIGGASMIFFMQMLCEQYSQDPRIAALVNNREVYIIPCMNPDGWEYNRSISPNGGGMWRKNRNGNGVDLNRNWGVDWGNCSAPITGSAASCGSSTSTSDTYYGPSAFSEIETQRIRDFTYTRHFVTMIDQHAYGPYYSLPFGRPSLPANVMDPLDAKFYTWVPAAMGKYNGMRAGNSPESVGYEVAGGVKDWMLKGNIGTGSKGKIYGMTGEGGHGTAVASGGTFWPPSAQIINLCKGMVHQNLQLLTVAGTHVDLTDLSDIAVGSKTGTFGFRALRVGLGNDPVTVSIIPLENIQSVGSPVVISPASLATYYDSYNGSISYTLPASLTDGQRIRFAWRIQEGGLTYYDTIVKLYHSTPTSLTVLSDNFNSGAVTDNWTRATNLTGTSNTWNFTASGTGYGGTGRALTESPSGNYAASANRSARWSNPFNLSDATAAYLTFWIRHRIENFRDKLRVQVSNSGTGGPWQTIAGNITIQEPGTLEGSSINGIPSITGIREEWVRAVFDLKDYIGAGNNNVYFRFEFTSDASNTSGFAYRQDDGVYIDDVKLVKTNASLITLPVEFKSFRGRLLANETVRLDWEAETDQLHDYFEVEKSTDGVSFASIGRGPAVAPYFFFDPSPAVGLNYYRIRQVDRDGRVTYSSIVTIQYQPQSLQVRAYPNPAKDYLKIRIQSPGDDQFTISLTDLAGRVIHQQQVSTGAGQQEWSIATNKLASQVYLLTVKNSRNEVVLIEKVTKQ